MENHSATIAGHEVARHTAHEAHELPNLFSLLAERFPHVPGLHFLSTWQNVFFSLLVAALISFVAIRAARQKQLIPQGLQNWCETIVEGVEMFVTGILGPEGRKYVPYLGTVFIYILFMNWLGLIPLMKSPTSSWGTTVAVALATMCYVQWTGIREQGLGHYLKHMAGNPSNLFGFFLIPLMLIINLSVEFVAVPLSLSLRLFANVSSEDRLLFKFAELNVLFKYLPFFFQLFANVLAIIFSMVQAFVFMLLTTVYLSLILPHEHSEHDTAHAH
jgi:F-type H+-transporting ATPase subunit a